MKLSFIAIIAGVSLALSGCMNVRLHSKGMVHHAYTGTSANIEAMNLCLQAPIFLIPLAVDLPLELVADTVTLPFDL